MKCWHRACKGEARHHIEVPHRHVWLCDTHFKIADEAEGGYSTVNTEDNIFGWRLR